jgi:hypothetical protein
LRINDVPVNTNILVTTAAISFLYSSFDIVEIHVKPDGYTDRGTLADAGVPALAAVVVVHSVGYSSVFAILFRKIDAFPRRSAGSKVTTSALGYDGALVVSAATGNGATGA